MYSSCTEKVTLWLQRVINIPMCPKDSCTYSERHSFQGPTWDLEFQSSISLLHEVRDYETMFHQNYDVLTST